MGGSAYQRSAELVVESLQTHAERGLSEEEARTRLARDGKNELIAEQPDPAWKKFLAQLRDPLVLLLLAATAVSAALWLYEHGSGLPYEALVILCVVLLNAVMGYLQGARAERALAALRQLSAAHARVIRDGEPHSIPAAELVCGDLISVESGDTIPADARLLRAVALQTAEAGLTGESLPVAKETLPISGEVPLGDRTNMLFSGTSASYGRGTAVVVATGMHTQMGLIAGALKAAPVPITPLQRELERVGKWLGIGVLVIATVMILTIVVVDDVHGVAALFDVLMLGVALAVAAVPEGLPAVVTAVLSMGVQRMARRNAIVRRLSAVETLGSASVIASDKTGTLTRNEMTVRAVVTASGRVNFAGTGYQPAGEITRAEGGAIDGVLRSELECALAVADRANDAVLQEHDGLWTILGDPTEGALLVAAQKAGLEPEALARRFERVAEVPFSSERKLMSTIHSDSEQERWLVFSKGAPDVLLARCSEERIGAGTRPLSAARRAQIEQLNRELAGQGLRTIGVAVRARPAPAPPQEQIDAGVEQCLAFAGLIGMLDPPRAEVQQAVARAKAAGIRPLMITGDHPITAAVIAAELGITGDHRFSGDNALTGPELDALSDEALLREVARVSVYARVNPGHKLRIVQALQRTGAIVAMTGDGVNDAPALRTADIGVAMGITGTDVSKEAADIVLADDNFASIVAAVEEGRAIFANIRKFLRYLLSSNLGEVLTMFLGVVLAGPLGLPVTDGGAMMPLLATQLLWINLVTDGAPALALGMDPPDEHVMSQPPRPTGEPVITLRMWLGIVFVGVIMAAGTLLVLDASLPGGMLPGSGDARYAQTMAFTTVVFFSLFTVFNARSDEQSAFRGLRANRWLWAAVLLSLVLQLGVVYLPFLQVAFNTVALSASDWLRCAAVGSSVLVLRELSKLVTRARDAREEQGEKRALQPPERRVAH